MTVKDFYLTAQGVNACRIHFGINHNNDQEYVNLYYIDPNPDFNFETVAEKTFEKYKDKEVKYFDFSIVDNKIVATLYLDKPEDKFIPVVEE